MSSFPLYDGPMYEKRIIDLDNGDDDFTNADFDGDDEDELRDANRWSPEDDPLEDLIDDCDGGDGD